MSRMLLFLLLALSTLHVVAAQPGGTWTRFKDPSQGSNGAFRTYLALAGDARSILALSQFNDGNADTAATVLERSIDGGVIWTTITPPGLPKPAIAFLPFPTLRAIAHPSPEVIVIVGDSGMIVRSTDAGEHWSMQQIMLRTIAEPTTMARPFTAISFVDVLHGTIIADRDFALVTHDGGQSWRVDTIRGGPFGFTSLRGVHTFDGVRAIVADAKNHIWRIDASHSWQIDSPLVAGVDAWDGSIEFASTGPVLWSTGYRHTAQNQGDRASTALFRSTDSGATWETVSYTEFPAFVFGSRAIDFLDEQNGMMMGLGDSSLHTTDGGETWHGVRVPFDQAPYMAQTGLVMLSDREAIAVAVNGDMVRFTSSASGTTGLESGGLSATALPMAWLRPVVPLPSTTSEIQLSLLLQPDCSQENLALRLVDVRGAIHADWSSLARLHMQSGTENTMSVSIARIPPGIYWVRLDGCDWHMVQPVVVMRR